jgi:hypothetical protein
MDDSVLLMHFKTGGMISSKAPYTVAEDILGTNIPIVRKHIFMTLVFWFSFNEAMMDNKDFAQQVQFNVRAINCKVVLAELNTSCTSSWQASKMLLNTMSVKPLKGNGWVSNMVRMAIKPCTRVLDSVLFNVLTTAMINCGKTYDHSFFLCNNVVDNRDTWTKPLAFED